MSGRILRTEGLVKIYSKRRVVNDVNIFVEEGEIVGLLGPNGAGKTTTFYMTVGLIKPNHGHIYLDHKKITHLPMYKRARMGVGYLAQEETVFRKMTVEQNIFAILETLSISKKERKERLESLLAELGLTHLAKSKAYQLSGGERRRLEITRALVIQPSFLLLDEPFAGVDPIAVQDIQQIIDRLKKKGIGVLITDHNVRETLSVTDRAYIIIEGKIFISGTSRELEQNPKAREKYLGERFKLD
ncbi:MAG: LPS export ABC transporter ATP-binding protein [Candidatus Cloacimonetes bacterium 4572_55]|nr:MAG: LPS export ABC transporter ATP-binding protein [Candidatus Cloacimonetes bacterium 4572_55]